MKTRRFTHLLIALGLTAVGLVAVPSPAVAGKSTGAPTITGTNVYKPAAGTPKNKVLVFLPGLQYRPDQENRFLTAAADKGYETIGLAWANSQGANGYCKKDKDPDCHEKVRREVLYGTDSTSHFKLKSADSVVSRLKVELASRPATSGFVVNGVLQWANIAVAGHSQGTGVAILAQDQAVSRVVLLAGPNDVARKTGNPAAWIDGTGATLASKWFSLVHQNDTANYPVEKKMWAAFGIPGTEVVAPAPTGSNRLTATAVGGDAHLSLAVDTELAGGTASPTLLPSWNYILG